MYDIISKMLLLHGLPDRELVLLAKFAVLKEFKKGDYVIHEDEKATHLHVVRVGKVKLVKHTAQGKDVIVDIAADGEPLSLESVFEGRGYAVSAIAAEKSTVVLIEKNQLLKIYEGNPNLMRSALAEMSRKSRELIRQIKELSVGKVDSRIANLILRLGDKIGQGGFGRGTVKIDIHLSRQDIADFTGTTVETAIRTMSRFAKSGMVKTAKDYILIEDRDQLEIVADMG